MKNVVEDILSTVASTKPFSTKRLLVGEFSIAESLLRGLLKKINAGKWFTVSPSVVIQPMEMCEGGLSSVEERVLKELAFGAGARKVIVWVGDELSDKEVVEKINN